MKIKKSTVEELVKRMVELNAAPFEEKNDAFHHVYKYAQSISNRGIGVGANSAWDVLTVASGFCRVNVETVTALFETVGVEVCDE